MTQERLLGGTLLAVSLAWMAATQYAIPEGFSGSAFGPRTFPFWLGALLAVLSLILIAGTFRSDRPGSPRPVGDAEGESSGREELWGGAATFGFLLFYLAAMQVLGFVVSTILVVAAFVYLVLGKRSLLLTAGMSVGMGVGIWFVMNHLLGVYLPTGMLGLGV